jgi:maltodextrin utilization protein YvdJ
MKNLLFIIALCTVLQGYGQQYAVGLRKTGSVIKNIEGQFVVTDSTVTATVEGQISKYKVTGRNGYTIHVTEGTTVGRFVITHPAGKLHGFTYDRQIAYHPEKHQPGTLLSVYYAKIQPKEKSE